MYEIFLALLVAIVFAGVLSVIARPRAAGRGDGSAAIAVGSLFLFFFVILFLFTWAGGLWLRPFGPAAWDVAWLPFVLVGLFVALLLAAAAAPEQYPSVTGPAERDAPAAAAALAFGLFFWILVIALLIAIGFGYWY